MAKRSAGAEPNTILAVVIELLETRGMDGWQLREVAERLRMSLSTLYKFFPSRDELIVAAVERWMEQHAFEPIVTPAPDKSVFEALNSMFHTIFQPWEQHPEMLHVYIRTGEAGARARLLAQGRAATRPLFRSLTPLDRSLASDLEVILTNVAEGAVARFSRGEIAVTDILLILERTLIRLEQAANTLPAPAGGSIRPQPGEVGAKRRRAARAN
jgi:AcrR family transcriptional regulator